MSIDMSRFMKKLLKLKLNYWLPIVFGCHSRDDRSFYFQGLKFPICARCTGEAAGIFCAIILLWFWQPAFIAICIMLLPLIVDGTVQKLTTYESNNLRRFVTGILFGIGITAFFAKTTVFAFDIGIAYGQSLSESLR